MFELVAETIQELNDQGESIYGTSYSLIKDEIKYKDVSVTYDKEELKIIPATVEMSNKLLNYSLPQFPSDCSIIFKIRTNWNGFNLTVKIKKADKDSFNNRIVSVLVSPILRNWKHVYSFDEFSKEFIQIISASSLKDKEEMGNPLGVAWTETVGLSYEYLFGYTTLSVEISRFVKYFDWVYEKVIKSITLKGSNKNVITSFDFPENLKVSCEQYLLYFTRFLQDLGINATRNLKEEAGKVLFSVTPTDDVEALDKIREALAVYLNLPSSPIVFDDSFAAMRLQQQIENLHHSQKMATRELQFNEKLLVAQSEMIHEKNVTISQLQSNNEQLIKIVEKISSPTIMMDSVENKEELEELYDGVKVGESETLKKWLGISLNPAKAIKTAVKNTFGKEENKSILGLDEEISQKNN